MKRPLGVFLALALASVPAVTARADDKDPQATLDKAIKALGGEEKLKKSTAFAWKTKGTMNFGGNESDFKSTATSEGLDRMRREAEFEINGEARKFVMIVDGDKGWMKFGEMSNPLEGDMLATQKRGAYMELAAITIVPLKSKGYKLEAVAEEKVDGKPAIGVKVTAPDGKDFTLYFDKESGLPVKQVARVAGFQGDENTQETTFKDYKEFGGLKKATKIDTRRDGEDFLKSEITEFKVLDKVDPKTFAEPT